MDRSAEPTPRIFAAARKYWSEIASCQGPFAATHDLLTALWEFLRNSTPARLRQRYGDTDYDWDHRVNTTSAAVEWRDRLLGAFHSPYQPTEPALFSEMLDALQQSTNLNFGDFSFLDLGSGKGRTLLMASDYPFRRIVGIELIASLHQICLENLSCYKSESQKCFSLECFCADATSFPFPEGPKRACALPLETSDNHCTTIKDRFMCFITIRNWGTFSRKKAISRKSPAQTNTQFSAM
jgi:SAM-dependent methyltransferase